MSNAFFQGGRTIIQGGALSPLRLP